MTVLVVAAHPDDELLGAGATLALHARRGDAVHAVVMSEGVTARYEEPMKEALEKAGRMAADCLGLKSIRFEKFPDQRMDTVPLVEVTQCIEAIVEEIQPSTVYTHFPGDVNADHGVVARAAWTACRPYRFPGVTHFAVFETPSSTEWGWPLPGEGFQPNRYVNVTATIDAKVEALECYESELRHYPHPRSARAIRERAAYWGSHVGYAAVEPFMVLREVSA
jgi:LmbE family N-acetylglucosaminyl deacetylase